MDENYEYRLSWEMPKNAHWCAAMEAKAGKRVWLTEWEACQWDTEGWHRVEWYTVTKITDNPWDQYNNLSRSAQEHTQPIRNVVLERRVRPEPDMGWEVYEPAHVAAARIVKALTPGAD